MRLLTVAVTLLALSVTPSSLQAQTMTIPQSGSTTFHMASGGSATIYDPGGTNYYQSNCNGVLTIIADNSSTITLTGTYNTEYSYDLLRVYEGVSTESQPIGVYSGLGNINVTAHSGRLTLQFISDLLVNKPGFELTASVCGIVDGQVYGVSVDSISVNSASLSWSDSTSTTHWTVRYGTSASSLSHQLVVDTTAVTITGLTPFTHYYYRIDNGASSGSCMPLTRKFRTLCPTPPGRCINYSDLSSCYVSASYGTYSNPDQNSGIVDYGSGSALSRHTVHTNLNEYDPRTDYMLKTVPPGYTSSVRLGNWQVGGQAESIVYEYGVDTNISSLLIMKYAAVLEDPTHSLSEQPKFSFKILDEDYVEINPSCYSANFVASASLGWNIVNDYYWGGWTSSTVLWKDWTTVGIDLSPFHGQTIFIKLTTFDCALQQHYGYAYFVFDCGEKTLMSENCGDVVENTFTAPDGFSYRWFNVDSSGVTLATTQSLHVTQAGEYHCTLQFIGAPAGSNCSFDLVALAGERYPTALFSWQQMEGDNCEALVQLHNNSVISRDSAHQQLTSLPCESVTWIVDGDSVSADNNPLLPLTPGSHNVRLVATIGGGSCADTTEQTILVGYPCEVFDTVSAAICPGASFTLFDTTLSSPGTYLRDSANLHRTLLLSFLNVDTAWVDTAIVENSLPFSWNGTSFTSDSLTGDGYPSSTLNAQFSTLNVHGCDSTVWLSLTVWRNTATTVDSTVCQSALPLSWGNSLFDSADFNFQLSLFSSTKSDTLSTAHGADSVVSRLLTVIPTSYADIYDTIVENSLPYSFMTLTVTADSLTGNGPQYNLSSRLSTLNVRGCDSVIHHHLCLHRNKSVALDSSVCENALPLAWGNCLFDSSDFNYQLSVFNSTKSVLLSGSHGEDSVVTMSLTVYTNSLSALSDTIVENQLPHTWNGVVFSADLAGTIGASTLVDTALLVNARGCDSVAAMSLTVWPNVTAVADSTVCENSLPLLWNGVTFTSADTATVNLASIGLHASHGEDSTLTMRLNVLRNSSYSRRDTVVENALPVVIDGKSFHHAVADTSWTTVNVAGCDSTIHYSLHVWNNYSHIFRQRVCDNLLPLRWCDTLFSHAATVELRYTSLHGADSVVTLILDVAPTYEHYSMASICQSQLPYSWNSKVILTEAFSGYTSQQFPLTDTLVSVAGCDSVVHITVSVHPDFDTMFYDTICDNQSVVFDGETVATAGIHSVSHTTVHGCDSALTLQLTVHATSHTFEYATVCDGVPYTWVDGVTYSSSTTTPTITFSDIHGCDSVRHLVLELDNAFHTAMEISPGTVTLSAPEVRLRDVSRSRSRQWFFEGSGVSDTGRVCILTYPSDADSLTLLLVARSAAGCIDSARGTVYCDRAVVWPPNAITPDEPQNNRFFIQSNDIASGEIWIYTRAGQLVAHFDAITGSWDGTFGGRPCPQGSYTWVMKYTTVSQPRSIQQAKGTVTVIR